MAKRDLGFFRKRRDEFRAMGGRFIVGVVTVQMLFGDLLLKCITIDKDIVYRIADCVEVSLTMLEHLTEKQKERLKKFR